MWVLSWSPLKSIKAVKQIVTEGVTKPWGVDILLM